MNYSLEFLVMADSPMPHSDFVQFLKGLSPMSTSDWSRSFIIDENLVEVKRNEESDSEKAKDPDDGCLYMTYRIEVTPLSRLRSESEQITLAQRIKRRIGESGGRAVVCAAFEDKL